MTQQPIHASSRLRFVIPGLALGLAFLVWSYWTTLAGLANRWEEDPQYSHGYLVPFFAAFYLWMRRRQLPVDQLRPSLWGVGLILMGTGMRLAGTRFHFGTLDQLSLLPCLAGLFVLLGGRAAFRWSLPAVAFLAFMVPLPHSWSAALSAPMQRFATEASTFALQVLGRPALSEGNVILLNDLELGIVEACSGLRMLMVFFALSTAMAMVIRKPLWEKCFVAASALPIALVANVLRITITGILYDGFGPELGNAVFHDLMGWLMMPVALSFLGIELWILNRLLLEQAGTPALVNPQILMHRVAVHPAALNPVALYRNDRPRREVKPQASTPQASTPAASTESESATPPQI